MAKPLAPLSGSL